MHLALASFAKQVSNSGTYLHSARGGGLLVRLTSVRDALISRRGLVIV